MAYPWAEPHAPVTDGPLGDLSVALERATDDYVTACNANAQAENAYLRAFSRAYVIADVAMTARAKWCDSQPEVTEAKCEWNIAQAREKACRSKCDELKNRLMAAMSWQRTVGAQT